MGRDRGRFVSSDDFRPGYGENFISTSNELEILKWFLLVLHLAREKRIKESCGFVGERIKEREQISRIEVITNRGKKEEEKRIKSREGRNSLEDLTEQSFSPSPLRIFQLWKIPKSSRDRSKYLYHVAYNLSRPWKDFYNR